MNNIFATIYPYIRPFGILIFSILTGIVFDKYILAKLKKIAEKTAWKGDDIIIASLKGRSRMLIFLAGVYAAVKSAPFDEKIISESSRWIVVLLIFYVTIVSSKILTRLIVDYYKNRDSIVPVISIFSNLTRMLVIVIGFLLILQYLGISIAPILTALGVGGLAVALALQDTLSNIFAGIQIIVARQINVGDYIMLESNIEGYVHDITWRYTTIKTMADNLVVVPNSKMASSLVSNFSLPVQELSIKVEVGVSYESDLEHVEEVTLDVAREVHREIPGCVTEYEPRIRYKTFGNSSINFIVLLRVAEFEEKFVIQHEFVKRLHRRFNSEGIVIPFPIRTVHLKNLPPENAGRHKISGFGRP